MEQIRRSPAGSGNRANRTGSVMGESRRERPHRLKHSVAPTIFFVRSLWQVLDLSLDLIVLEALAAPLGQASRGTTRSVSSILGFSGGSQSTSARRNKGWVAARLTACSPQSALRGLELLLLAYLGAGHWRELQAAMPRALTPAVICRRGGSSQPRWGSMPGQVWRTGTRLLT